MAFQVFHYRTAKGVVIYQEWLDGLADERAVSRISARVDRIYTGSLGDTKPVGGGVYELRVDYGPGYRIYYAIVRNEIVLLLCGGDKRRQNADIARAIGFLKDYKNRTAKP